MFDHIDREAVVAVIRSLVAVVRLKAQHSGAEDHTLAAAVSKVSQITSTTVSSVLSTAPAGNQRLSVAAYADLLVRFFAEAQVYGQIPASIMDDLTHQYIAALCLNTGDLWEKYQHKVQTLQESQHLYTTRNVLSPAMHAVLVQLNPDAICTVGDAQKLVIVLNSMEAGNYQHSKNALPSERMSSARLVYEGKLSAAEMMFLQGVKKSKDDHYRDTYSQYAQYLDHVPRGWQRDLLTSTAVYTWIHHPQQSLDYDEFSSMVGEHDLSEYSAPLMSAALVMQDTSTVTASTGYSRSILLNLYTATEHLTR
jgi:hypothetical protein